MATQTSSSSDSSSTVLFTSTPTTKYIVAYHYPCPDGIFGALAAYLYFQKNALLSSIHWLPLTVYSKENERITKLENLVTLARSSSTIAPSSSSSSVPIPVVLYLIDFSGGTHFLSTACTLADRVILIDHHKTAAEDLASNPDLLHNQHFEQYIDMNHSGATLSRAYFTALTAYQHQHQTTEIGKNLVLSLFPTGRVSSPSDTTVSSTGTIDDLFAYIEDNDLFKFHLPNSKEFTAGFGSQAWEFDVNKNPSIFSSLLQLHTDTVIQTGKIEIEKQDKIITEELSTAFTIVIPLPSGTPLTALAVITNYPDYRSVAGNRLAILSAAKDGCSPVGIIAYEEKGMGNEATIMYKVSLRSTGDYDTTSYSRQYGGGGHRNASSFVVSKTDFLSWQK